MRRVIIHLFTLSLALPILFTSSCKQCSTGKENGNVTVKDTSAIPGLNALNAAIEKDSLNPELYFKRAQLFDANGDLKSAATDMFLALTLDSLKPEYFVYAADIFKKTGEPQRGIALMNKAIATDSFNTVFYVKAAELAYIDTTIKGNYAIALNYLNTAIGKDPQNADIYFYKGNIFKEAGDTAKAVSSFQTATELNPRYYEAYVQLGLLLKAKKDKNAAKYLDNAIKVNDKPEDALYAKANLLKEQGVALYDAGKTAQSITVLQQAIASFKQVIEVNHRNVEAYMGIGFSYYQMDSVQEAYEFYDKALKMAPTYAGAYFSKGLCAEDLGKIGEAIMLYENCLNIDPDFTRAKEHLSKLKK